MRALEAHGRRVGEDFALIGFGDSASRLVQCDFLSSVRINTRQMERLRPRHPRVYLVSQARTIVVPDRLMRRGTTGRMNKATVSCKEPKRLSKRMARVTLLVPPVRPCATAGSFCPFCSPCAFADSFPQARVTM